MQHIPNPLLTLLLRPEQKAILTWRMTVILSALLTGGGVVVLLAIMLNTKDYAARERFQDLLGGGYLLFVGLSLLMPVLMAVYGAILTKAWTGRDEKFDLLRLTPLHERAFVESYFIALLHRVRLLLGLQAVLGLLTPVVLLISIYWDDHPAPTYYSTYGYQSDYQSYTPLGTYIGTYGILLLYNVALGGLSLIGGILGVRFGTYARNTTSAITLSAGSTCGSMLGLAAAAGCLTYGVAGFLFSGFDSTDNDAAAILLGYTCVATVCILPVFALFTWYIGQAQWVIRRD